MDLDIKKIAAEILNVDSLEAVNSDSADFHDLAVWNIKAALEAAYAAGKQAASV